MRYIVLSVDGTYFLLNDDGKKIAVWHENIPNEDGVWAIEAQQGEERRAGWWFSDPNCAEAQFVIARRRRRADAIASEHARTDPLNKDLWNRLHPRRRTCRAKFREQYTFAKFIGRDNSGEYYSTQVVLMHEANELYRQTQCGFGDNYPTAEEAQTAADAWVKESEASDFAAR